MGTPVIIAGMHRSGTSLFANLIQEAGVHIGEKLRAATEYNRKGYFEDYDFVKLHDAILTHNQTSWCLEKYPAQWQITPSHQAQAESIIVSRHQLPIWGWKDPRTSLFLDFWHNQLPNALFLFIFRSAEEVVDSLRRRNDTELNYHFHGAWLLRQLGFSTFRMRRAINMWLGYNQAVVRFMKAHPEQSYLLDLADLPRQFSVLLQHLRSRHGLDMKDIPISTVMDRDLLQSTANRRVAAACRKCTAVSNLYSQLKSLSCR